MDRLDDLARRNGTRPQVPEGTTWFIELLASCPSATPERANFLLSVPTAASLLGVSRQRVRLLADQGRFPGAAKISRDWLIPPQDIEAYRRTRRAA